MQSANNTLIAYGGAITDASGNVWTITSGGQVAVNGIADPTTANVTHLAYANGLVWQENTRNLWWSKASPSAAWSPPQGTTNVPVPIPNAAVDDAVIGAAASGAPTPSLTDKSGNTWALVNGRVVVNGVVDTTTANVRELAYRNGKIWQENNQGLWWSKSTPADSWYPPAGTSVNPVTGNFYVYNPSGDEAIINVGVLTTSPEGGSGMPPLSVSQIITPSVQASGSAIHVSSETATLVVTGNSSLTNGADLTLIGAYRTPRPVYGPLQNNGVMTMNHATLQAGAVSGTGAIHAANGSTLDIQSASASGETIQLSASHLYIGGQGGGPGTAGVPGGMSFLAPITMDSASTITLNALQATSEVLTKSGGMVSEVFLYNGTTEVADLKVHGVANLYASNVGSGSTNGVLLSTTPPAHPLPLHTA